MLNLSFYVVQLVYSELIMTYCAHMAFEPNVYQEIYTIYTVNLIWVRVPALHFHALLLVCFAYFAF